MDQPPQAKKAKVKTSTVDLPIENQLLWHIDREMLNLYIENEVVVKSLTVGSSCGHLAQKVV